MIHMQPREYKPVMFSDSWVELWEDTFAFWLSWGGALLVSVLSGRWGLASHLAMATSKIKKGLFSRNMRMILVRIFSLK